MTVCLVCGSQRSRFVMNNKRVCLKCDELLFDIEIECDDEPVQIEPSLLYKEKERQKEQEKLKRIPVIKSRVPRR